MKLTQTMIILFIVMISLVNHALAAQQQAQQIAQADATPRNISKKIALQALRDFRNKIYDLWQPPVGKIGEKAGASVVLTAEGQVKSILVHSSDLELKHSIVKAIRAAAPYPMPSDPEAKRLVQSFKVVLTVK